MLRPISPDHMTADDIQELYYILPVDNFESVLRHGILSHHAVRTINHSDISNASVQGNREKLISSPRTHQQKPLHDFANLYIQPYNSMLLVVQGSSYTETPISAENLCLLRISKTLLNDRKDQAILTNQNAACSSAKFFKPEDYRLSPTSTKALKSRCLKGDDNYWLEPDDFKEIKPKRQAEALFPDRVPADYINGVFVSNENTKNRIAAIVAESAYAQKIDITVKPSMFPSPKPKYGYVFNQRFSPFEILSDSKEESESDVTSHPSTISSSKSHF